MKTFLWPSLVGLAILYFAVVETLDWVGRMELIEQKWPKVWSAMSNRPMRLALLVVLCILLSKDVLERWQDGAPQLIVNTPPPSAPIVQFLSAQAPASVRVERAQPHIIQKGNGNQANQVTVNGKQTTNAPGSPIINGSNNTTNLKPQ
jgi:hypothetical protein